MLRACARPSNGRLRCASRSVWGPWTPGPRVVYDAAMRLGKRPVVLLAVLAAGWLWPASARACTCWQEIGAGRFYHGEGGMLPAGARGIPWSGPVVLKGSRGRLSLVRHVKGRKLPIKYTIEWGDGVELIVPAGGLLPGAQYTASVSEADWRRTRAMRQQNPEYAAYFQPAEITTTFSVAMEPLVPGEATLRLDAPRRDWVTTNWVSTGTCSASVSAVLVDLQVMLPAALEPFRDYLLYETIVDDHAWMPLTSSCSPPEPGRSWMVLPGADRIFAVDGKRFNGSPGVGPHVVAVKIRTPDGAQTWTTPGVPFVLDDAAATETVQVVEPAPIEPAPVVPAQPVASEPAPTATPRGCNIVGSGDVGWMLPLLALGVRRRRRFVAAV